MPFLDAAQHLPEASHYALNNQRKKLAALLASGRVRLEDLGPGDHPTFPVDPLSVGARMGYTGIVETLLDAGAVPVPTMSEVGNTDVARLLKARLGWPGDGEALAACLHRSARQGRYEMVRHWLREGAPVDALDAAGETPLMALARHYTPGSAKKEALERGWKTLGALLDAGARMDHANALGATALLGLMRAPVHPSDERFQVGAAQLLLERGANPNVPCAEGSVLWVALGRTDQGAMGRLLAAHGALILPPAGPAGEALIMGTVDGEDGPAVAPETVMLRAVRSGSPAMVDLALAQRADLTVAGQVPGVVAFEGRAVTPLMLATHMAWNEGLHALLDAFRHQQKDLGAELLHPGWNEPPLAGSPIRGSIEALVLLRTARRPDPASGDTASPPPRVGKP